MSTIELYNDKNEAFGARDHYNHHLNRRAVVAAVPTDEVVDFGGGPKNRIVQEEIDPVCWMLVVEDPVE